MIMRPGFEQHTVHFTPNASPPTAFRRTVAINIGGSFTYYYPRRMRAYFWHCHITPPEHLQMGMVGQPRPAAARSSFRQSLQRPLNQQAVTHGRVLSAERQRPHEP
jgi:hypothetical protein